MEKSFKKPITFRLPLVIFLIILAFTLGGCTGKREVEDLAFVIGIGVDQGEKPENYLVTFQMALPKSGNGSSAEIENWTLSAEVKSVPEIAQTINQMLDKQPFAGTTRIIILGEDLARNGINDVLDSFERFYQFRRTAYLIVAKGEAKEILETQVRSSELPSLNLVQAIQGQPRSSTFPVTRIGHYFTVLGREGQNPLIPTVEKIKPGDKGIDYSNEKGEQLLIHGAGVFDDGKLVGFLNDEETRGYLWLDNETRTRYVEAQGESGFKVSAWVKDSSTKYKIQPIKDKMGITFQIKVDVAVFSIDGQQGSLDKNEWAQFVRLLESDISRVIEKECQTAVNKSKSTKMDFNGIGRKIEIKKPKYWKQVKNDWLNQIPNIPVNYDIKVTILHTGLPTNNPTSPINNRQEYE